MRRAISVDSRGDGHLQVQRGQDAVELLLLDVFNYSLSHKLQVVVSRLWKFADETLVVLEVKRSSVIEHLDTAIKLFGLVFWLLLLDPQINYCVVIFEIVMGNLALDILLAVFVYLLRV